MQAENGKEDVGAKSKSAFVLKLLLRRYVYEVNLLLAPDVLLFGGAMQNKAEKNVFAVATEDKFNL